MSAADEVRCLLDECGACYQEISGLEIGLTDDYRRFCIYDDHHMLKANIETNPHEETVFLQSRCFPKNAVDAIFGREKCKIISGICSRCGALIHESANMYWQYLDGGFRTVKHRPVNYCPNCGKEVEK